MNPPRTWLPKGLKALKPWGVVRLLAAGVLLMGGGVLFLAQAQDANLGNPPASEGAEAASTIADLEARAPGGSPPANRDTYDLSLWDLPGDYPGAGAETVSAPDIPELAQLWDGHKGCYHTYDEHPLGQNVC